MKLVSATDGSDAAVSDYCNGKVLWYRFADDGVGGPLRPGALGPGTHTVRVAAADFAGHAAESSFGVCVPDAQGTCAGDWSIRQSDGGGVSRVEFPELGTSGLRLCLASVGCGPADLSGPFDVRSSWERCEGPGCPGLDAAWQCDAVGPSNDASGVEPGDTRCFDVAWTAEQALALEEVSSGRLLIRVASAGESFTEGAPPADRRAVVLDFKVVKE